MPNFKPFIRFLEGEKVKTIDLDKYRKEVVNTKQIVTVAVEEPKKDLVDQEKIKVVVAEKQTLDDRVDRIKGIVTKVKKPSSAIKDKNVVELW